MKPVILLVDDEPQFERLVRQRLRKKIKAGQFELMFAKDGVEALDMLQNKRQIDMVLTDINMPNMDGLTLIGEIKKLYPLLKSVVVSAYGDMKNIRTAMNLGAFDFLTKPIDFNDLERTIFKTLEEVELLKKVEQVKALSQKNQDLIELDALKTKFFTNISHEFRTPLTVIGGMTEQIKEKPQKWLLKGMTTIERNVAHLLNLVNQILDLKKLEAGKMELNVVHADIVPLFYFLTESFQPIAESKDLKLQLVNHASEIIMDYDEEKVQRIIANLLSNAIKFTPQGGNILLKVEKTPPVLRFFIEDTGIGIATNEKDHIFNRFYQLNTTKLNQAKGTGIGLALCKELVLLMNGSIEVDSEIGKGSIFKVTLPIIQKNVANKIIKQEKKVWAVDKTMASSLLSKREVVIGTISPDLPRLLIIEDNREVAQYIINCLEEDYQLFWAKDGQEGINKALTFIPDLIISDIMMPNKNGYEVCDFLKNNFSTNHIPIILLTANVNENGKIKGFKNGADAYLVKPFDKKELLARLDNLLKIREQLRRRFTTDNAFVAEQIPQTDEEAFIFKVRSIIENKMENDTFDSSQLCKEMMMSKTLLYLKLKAMTGYSAALFIRLIRLQKAKKILESTNSSISEVAFGVGFKDPKYFSRVFTEEFGLPPSKMRKSRIV
jgi:signal transduction histidine kinase/AraC-like DNA-binding protein